jgi:hypothetical protein
LKEKYKKIAAFKQLFFWTLKDSIGIQEIPNLDEIQRDNKDFKKTGQFH